MFSSSEALSARKCKVLFQSCFCDASGGVPGDKGPTGDKGLTGDKGPTGDKGLTGEPLPQGNTLFVDAVYGDDASGNASPNLYAFKTIQAALNKAATEYSVASIPQNVKVRAGIYDGSLNIPANISLTGDAPQAVIIQKRNVSTDTTLITMGVNSRVENFTAILDTSNNVNLTGVHFPTGTSTTAKLRNSIWTVRYDGSGANTVYGVLSDGSDNNPSAYTTPNAIQRSTVNVISTSTGVSRGIYINNANRFSVRDIVVYARGTGTDITGVETNHASAVFECKTSTLGGDSALTNFDIHRNLGTMILGSTDLLHNDANGKSFKPAQAPSLIQYGIFKTALVSGNRYYLVPGTIQTNQLEMDNAPLPAFDISKCLPFVFDQESSVISLSITIRGNTVIDVSGTLNVKIYEVNNTATEVLNYDMTTGKNYYNNMQSHSFTEGSLMAVALIYTGTATITSANVIIGYY